MIEITGRLDPPAVLHHPRLSLKAKALALILNDLHDTRIDRPDLLSRSTDGRDAHDTGIRELETHGLLRRVHIGEGYLYRLCNHSAPAVKA